MRVPRRFACILAASTSMLVGCIGVSQKRYGASSAASPSSSGAPSGPTAAIKECRAGTRPADDGVIDDFEDGNTQVNPAGGRDGYWYSEKDSQGSTLSPDPFAPSEGGADGSAMAIHISGQTTTGNPAEAWGAGFGLRWVSQDGSSYDASRYAGLSFKARVDEKSTRRVRLKIGDINTHPDGHVCKNCYNHFGRDFAFSPKWREYTVLFSEARQEPGWGDPRPSAITPGQLYAMDFQIAPGQAYDLWIDDVVLLDCK